MPPRIILLALGLIGILGSCTSTNREWMKIGQPYTVEEFRRDFAQCTKSKELDEACMRDRGWVDMNRGAEQSAKEEKAAQDKRLPGHD